MTLYFVDVSDFNGDVDEIGLARNGIAILTTKATEGTSFQHSTYKEHVTSAKNAGLVAYGAYMVPRTPGNQGSGSVRAQVDYFLNYLDQQTPWWRTDPRFIIQIDLEDWGVDYPSIAIGQQTINMCKATGKFVTIYASHGHYGDEAFQGTPRWNADYVDDSPGNYTELYNRYGGDSSSSWHGNEFVFWQFTQRGFVGSYQGDVSAFRGNKSDLENLIGISQATAYWWDNSDSSNDW